MSPREYGIPRYIRYDEYPVRTVNHWKRDEPRGRKMQVYKDVPDYIKWKQENMS